MPDITVQKDGDFFLVKSTSEAGRDWLEDNMSCETPMQGPVDDMALVVEQHDIWRIMSEAQQDGLKVIS
jgi:hypothetical protein